MLRRALPLLFGLLLGRRRPLRAAEVYVSTEDGGEIVAVDPDRGEVVARIPVGKRPRGVKLSPDGKTLYVALSGSPRAAPGVDETKLPPRRSIRRRRGRGRPGRAQAGPHHRERRRSRIVRPVEGRPPAVRLQRGDRGDDRARPRQRQGPVRTVKVGDEPEGVTLRPDGKLVYVTSEQGNQVVAVDTNKTGPGRRAHRHRRTPARDRGRRARWPHRLRHLRERRSGHRVRRGQEQTRRADHQD